MSKQMKLNTFCKEFDVPRTTALKWVHSDGFPAYNICGHWYCEYDIIDTYRILFHKILRN